MGTRAQTSGTPPQPGRSRCSKTGSLNLAQERSVSYPCTDTISKNEEGKGTRTLRGSDLPRGCATVHSRTDRTPSPGAGSCPRRGHKERALRGVASPDVSNPLAAPGYAVPTIT